VAKHLHDTGRIARKVRLETIAGTRAVELLGVCGATAQVRAELGTPSVRELPLRLSGLPPEATAALPPEHVAAIEAGLAGAVHVSIGTPHVVVQADVDLPGEAWQALSRALERAALENEPTNVTWLRPVGTECIEARFWERGVSGETLACGTGAGASMVAARRAGLVGDEAAIVTKGGKLRASWNGHGEVHVEGPATTVFRGEWPFHGPGQPGSTTAHG